MKILTKLSNLAGCKRKDLLSKKLIKVSDKIIGYGTQIQNKSYQKFVVTQSNWLPLTRNVLQQSHEQIITYHRSIRCLANHGWAPNALPLLRIISEIIINCTVILKDDSELRSFKYFVFELLKFNPEEEDRAKIIKDIKENELYKLLSDNNKTKADEYLNQSDLGYYWYQKHPKIFNGPKDVVKKELPVLLDIYEIGSSAIHGGLLGYRFFEGKRSHTDIHPRTNLYQANFCVMQSLRYLLEFCNNRSIFESLELENQYKYYLNEFLGLKKILDNYKNS